MTRSSFGTVNPGGGKTAGTNDWTVRQDGEGLYLIVFEPSFTRTPSAVATQIYPNDLASNGGDTRDNAVVVGIDVNELKIKTGSGDGKAANRWFSFVVNGF